MADYIFGEIEGVNEGQIFKDRTELRQAHIHLAIQAGIDGNSKVGSPSIILSGGYSDDFDLGDEILYTGHGGTKKNNSKIMVEDQSWNGTGNKGLIISELHGLPVRVTRGHKHKSEYSPKEGYKYGGLYRVTEHFEDIGKDGFKICRFRLEKINPSDSIQPFKDVELSQGFNKTERKATTILRIVRDTKLSKEIKQIYDYTCQVCNLRIAIKNVGYAEAAHIKPLGKPHNGADTPENLLCLCPNHHVMFDKGMFAINEDLSLVGIEGQITMHKKHSLDNGNLAYHKEHVFIAD